MSDTTIRCRDNGPLVVTGPVRIVDADGNEFDVSNEKGNVALCRCGSSGQRPFCDGTHKRTGFQAVDRAVDPQS